MIRLSKSAKYVFKHPVKFALQTLRAFNKNQGILLAGAVAYYALMSILPLLIFAVIILSHVINQAELLSTLGRYLERLVPSQSQAVLVDVSNFLKNRIEIGAVLFVTMIFFSTLAFTVLEKATNVIFAHRSAIKKRHFLISAIIPYCLVLFLCISMLAVTLASIVIQTMAHENMSVFGHQWSLSGLMGILLYLIGFLMETFFLSLLYLVLPIGKIRARHALIGGLIATSLWEVLRHILFWYFSTFSNASIVYGSLTTAVLALLSLEFAAILFLLGAQVISEYERLGQ